eukprot:770301-Rhodomonas_salina.2
MGWGGVGWGGIGLRLSSLRVCVDLDVPHRGVVSSQHLREHSAKNALELRIRTSTRTLPSLIRTALLRWKRDVGFGTGDGEAGGVRRRQRASACAQHAHQPGLLRGSSFQVCLSTLHLLHHLNAGSSSWCLASPCMPTSDDRACAQSQVTVRRPDIS